ncbi:hypothetical protein GALL_30810 [mine drainage metagenome]|uniref:Cytochrome c domain-containing protein n=1 Tax=mine drainage metagenome TaxID=410659 RepID=A0A1J5T661_9ZZZZ
MNISRNFGFLRVAASICASAAILVIAALVYPMGYAHADSSAGEAIYRRGILDSGAPLVAYREGGIRMEGADAACVNCHRRSGFGVREGSIPIPPITGAYLLRRNDRGTGDQSLPYVETMHVGHDPSYTDETLARAIREGVDAAGKPLSYLMPQFELNDADMAALIAYLKSLDQRKTPGVTDTVLNFATIITPDADPVKRRGMLDVIERYFADRNAVQFAPSPRLRTSTKTAWANTMFMVNRRWQLHVWELTGPANTWEEQLKQDFAKEPVLAVVSGLGGKNWEPVHAFCEHEDVPCLFPNVEVPPINADRDFYSLYFSRGVLLEAQLIANSILESGNGKVVHQIYRAGESGEPAAEALSTALESHGVTVHTHVLAQGASGRGVTKVLRKASGANVLVLWLRPPDVAALGNAPASPAAVFMSGLMGGLEYSPLPSSWRSRTRLAYPFDLPEKRIVPVDYALGWFAIRHIPVVDEQVQADTFLACGLLAETLSDMADTFVPVYLVERVQDMLAHRIITGYYPHLSLAPGQRFASKGGYVVHFADPKDGRLVADSNWLVP